MTNKHVPFDTSPLHIVPRTEYRDFINGTLLLFPAMEKFIDHAQAQARTPDATGCLVSTTPYRSIMQWLYKGQLIAQAYYTPNRVVYYTRPMFEI